MSLSKLVGKLGMIFMATALVLMSSNLAVRVLAFDTSSANYINATYYNSLVGDADFVAVDSMTPAEIQNFLASKGGYLASAPAGQLGDRANGRSAAQIIYDAAHASGEASGSLNGISISPATGTISPKAILTTLQKEQSLVTRTDYSQAALDKAMGYGCPDAGGCNPTYAGFTNQVEWASWQLRYNYEAAAQSPAWWAAHYSTYYYVGYSRSHNWGNTYYVVTYKNRSTAALYRYTPHVGNGNYNFWHLMIEWFNVAPVNFGGGSLAINDTETIAQGTYRSHIKIAGTKTSDVRTFFDQTLIADTGSTSWATEFDAPIGTTNFFIYYRDLNGTELARKQITIDRHKVGDINDDGRVDLLDISMMSDAWGLTVKDDASLNLNPETDSVVDLLDLSLLANAFEG